MNRIQRGAFYALIGILLPEAAFAADVEGILKNIVTAFVSRLLPVLALGYLGKNIFAHIQDDPQAKQQTPRIVIAIACLIGINAVWSYISQMVR